MEMEIFILSYKPTMLCVNVMVNSWLVEPLSAEDLEIKKTSLASSFTRGYIIPG